MKPFDIFLLALRNLRQAKLRATLTITGVVVGVASIVCMVSFGLGLQENLLNQTLSKFDIFTTIPVTGASISAMLEMGQANNESDDKGPATAEPGPAGGTREERRERVFARMAKAAPRRLLDDKAISEIRAMPEVEHVFVRIGFSGILQFNGHTRQLNFSGAPADLTRLPGNRALLAGLPFTSDYARELIVGENMLRSFITPAGKQAPVELPPGAPFPSQRAPKSEALRREEASKVLGMEVTLLTLREAGSPPRSSEALDALDSRYERQSFRIVGVLANDEARGMFSQFFVGNGNLFVPMGTAKLYSRINGDPLSKLGETLLGDTGYQAAVVKVRTPADTQVVYERLNKSGLRAISLTQQLSQIRLVFIIIDCSLALIAGISLFVAAIGISNTLIMSITERTREIGIMKAIGAEDRTIMGIFFSEAGLLGLSGGVLGVSLGWILDSIANLIVNKYVGAAGGHQVDFFFIPWYLAVGSVLFALAVSLLAAAYPALRAARVDPIKALRHD